MSVDFSLEKQIVQHMWFQITDNLMKAAGASPAHDLLTFQLMDPTITIHMEAPFTNMISSDLSMARAMSRILNKKDSLEKTFFSSLAKEYTHR